LQLRSDFADQHYKFRRTAMINSAAIRKALLGISPIETKYSRRGFQRAEPAVQEHLETAGRRFVEGYNAALAKSQPEELAFELNHVEAIYRGFAFEGAAMALGLLDRITPWNRRRLAQFIESFSGDAHVYMLHIGAGWAIARIPWARRNFEQAISPFHRLYRWLAVDGYGFHEGFFHTNQSVKEQAKPPRLSDQAAQVFDQGLGRSLWFSQGGNPSRIATTIAAFPMTRRADLWSGAGLAASYAGGVDRVRLVELRDRAAGYAAHLAQGASFAAKARQRADNPVPHTELACEVFCRLSAKEAAAVTDACLNDLPTGGAEPAYQVWRARIRERFAAETETNTAQNHSQQPVS
jgi:hypothetical protein